MVLATQNPIEQEGTYPLPEAQLDRFLFELLIEYPVAGRGEEGGRAAFVRAAGSAAAGPDARGGAAVSQAIAQVPAAPNVIDYAVRLVRATRPVSDGGAPDYVKRWIRWGASPRASQYLILAGRARAACQGRFNVACEDVAALAPLVLRHRHHSHVPRGRGREDDRRDYNAAPPGCAEGVRETRRPKSETRKKAE